MSVEAVKETVAEVVQTSLINAPASHATVATSVTFAGVAGSTIGVIVGILASIAVFSNSAFDLYVKVKKHREDKEEL